MNKKEYEIAERSFNIIEKCKYDLLKLCEGETVSLTISVLLASADFLMDSAKEVRERANERKGAWDLIRDVLKETLK